MTFRQAIESRLSDQACRVSVYAVAKQAGIDFSNLRRYMATGRGLSADSLERLCGVLGLELRAHGVERVAETPPARAEVPPIVPTPTIPHQPREDPRKARKLGL